MTDADSFVTRWSMVWRGADSDPELYMELLHEGCRLINPLDPTTREQLLPFFDSVLAVLPDIRVVPTRWAETDDDSVLIEWVNTGTLNGSPVEIRGVDRYTLRDGKATEGYSYFDPRPLLASRAPNVSGA
jgi:ketosteroid isomerase-like protein